MRYTQGLIALILVTLGPSPSGAEDFTFRRLSVGDINPGKRITVQIDPEEQARYLAALPKVDPKPIREHDDLEPVSTEDPKPTGTPAAAPTSSYAWFWDTVPAGLDQVSGRFDLALATLTQGPDGKTVAAPRLQSLQKVSEVYGIEILKATIGTDVSPALVLAVIGIESAGQPEALSHAGAVGLMQLIPATAERFGVSDSTDPVENIKGGVAYLDWLLDEFDNDPLMVLAAYNAGEGAVRANQGVPPYAETRDYVPKVLAAWTVAQGLCQTAPMLVTDPCVFRAISAGG